MDFVVQIQITMEEEWRDVVGYEGLYQVSNIGSVRSLDRIHPTTSNVGNATLYKRKGSVMSPKTEKSGYITQTLSKDKITKTRKVHRLVAQAFIPNPEKKPQVNHKNGIKSDNRVENLEWVTTFENRQHAYDTGLQKPTKGTLNGMAVYTERDVEFVSIQYAMGMKQVDIERTYEYSKAFVHSVVNNKSWRHVRRFF